MPGGIYTSPEIASVGMTADEAKAAGRAVKTGKFVMFSNSRTMTKDGGSGIMRPHPTLNEAISEDMEGTSIHIAPK